MSREMPEGYSSLMDRRILRIHSAFKPYLRFVGHGVSEPAFRAPKVKLVRRETTDEDILGHLSVEGELRLFVSQTKSWPPTVQYELDTGGQT